jgi:hypothetical protein
VITRKKWIAGCTVAGLLALAWPGPAGADSSLGGYTVTSSASVIHVEVFEPVLPLPSNPQGDVSIGYTATNADSGPSTRALASYVWPGAVIGDGFDQLTGKPGSVYPVQVNSRYPATASAPAKNTAQITDGNGMTTSTDGATTSASVTGLGIAGQGVNLLGGLGQGLSQLGGKGKAIKPPPDVPVPVSSTLAALVTAKGITSTTTVKVADKLVTSTSTAAAADISILHGIIGLSGINVTNTVTSDGTKATVAGSATIGGLTIAGLKVGLGDGGITIGTTAVKLPELPTSLTGLLKSLGVEISVSPVTKTVSGATGTFEGQALVISIDTGPLKQALNGPLSLLINLLGTSAATNLAPVIQLAPRIVLKLGEANATVSASPPYSGGGGFNGGGGSTGGGTGTGGTPGSPGGVISIPNPTVGPTGPTTGPGTTTTGPGSQPQTAAYSLPGLGEVPRFLIIGALILAALIGWLMQAAGGLLLGGGGTCGLGLSTGIPDLRKE